MGPRTLSAQLLLLQPSLLLLEDSLLTSLPDLFLREPFSLEGSSADNGHGVDAASLGVRGGWCVVVAAVSFSKPRLRLAEVARVSRDPRAEWMGLREDDLREGKLVDLIQVNPLAKKTGEEEENVIKAENQAENAAYGKYGK